MRELRGHGVDKLRHHAGDAVIGLADVEGTDLGGQGHESLLRLLTHPGQGTGVAVDIHSIWRIGVLVWGSETNTLTIRPCIVPDL